MPLKKESDFLIIGSGIAGLLAASKLSSLGPVTVVTKEEASRSNTNFAQGGIASVTDFSDSFDSHIRDTLEAGAGLCDTETVGITVREGPERIKELMRLGVSFTKKESGFDLGLEGGHSKRRILHVRDFTGREIEKVLLDSCRKNPNIRFYENHVAVDLILEKSSRETKPENNRCRGAYVLDTAAGEVHAFKAGRIILASGGAGKVYLYTSNPDIATGDGMAMAFRAGVPLHNLEFVQFHPTCLYHPKAKSFLISEALRGEGGILRLADGTAFMKRYSPSAELAPRDIVARAIDSELKRTGEDCVYLDMTHLKAEFLKSRFPNIDEKCLSLGIDLAARPIPVVPAAHFFCGGTAVDIRGATCLPGLYSIGEVSCTGLHGANRLASNSLLEACVFAHRVFLDISKNPPGPSAPFEPAPWNPGTASQSDEAVVIAQNWNEIRTMMWNYVGIVRSNKRLERAARRMELISEEIRQYYWDFLLTRDLVELRNIACLAEQIIRSAMARRESRGLHYNINCPDASDSWKKNTAVDRYS
ncbi:MAG: L-aspartate oxidase [bacterium]